MNVAARLLAAFALCAPLAACAPDSTVDTDYEAAVDVDDALSASGRTFVTVRPDYYRKCAWPMCGGVWVKDVNRAHAKERYVSALNFENAGFDQETIDIVNGAAEGEVVLRAKLGPIEPTYNTRELLVYEAYRGLPGQAPYVSDLYYSVDANDPPIQCFTAPCNNLTAKKLNSTKKTSFTGNDIEFGGLIDDAWLAHRVESGDAIVAGELYEGAMFPGGPETLLFADQVFLKLPEVAGPCPAVKLAQCPSGQAWSYTRSEDRCILPDTCVEAGACAAYVPSCAEGYSLSSWTGGPFACTQYACDPSWLFPEQ